MDTIKEFSDSVAEFIHSDNDRAATIFAFSMLEQFISDVLERKSKHPKSYQHLSIAVKVNLLHELNEISNNDLESINWLKKQRNKVAHSIGYKINRDEIQERWLMPALSNKDIFSNYLTTTVLGFWNNHPELNALYQLTNKAET